MDISKDILRSIAPYAVKNIKANANLATCDIDGIVTLLNRYAPEFGITTAIRWAHFLAQICHESAEFLYTVEQGKKSYFLERYGTGALASRLGNKYKIDGYNFRGRGLIQITGRYNYTKYKEFCGYDVVAKPDLLMQPVGAIRSAMWYWQTHGLNALADKDDFKGVTKTINGGYNGIDDRRKYLERAKKALRC